MIRVSTNILLDESELQFSFIRSPGPGGQNVNKVETAVMLRFNIKDSACLSEEVRERLLQQQASRLTSKGELIIKASRFRTQERNKMDALERLMTLLKLAAKPPKKRKKTKPTKASKERRLEKKKIRSQTKALRGGKFY